MNTKKRKPLGSAMEEFVFGTKEAALLSTAPQAAPPAPTPAASLITETAPTPETAWPVLTPAQPEAPAAEPIPVPSKESSLMSKLQAPDKEATVRFTVDMSETLHRKLSMLAAKTGRKKVDIVRMLLEEGLKEEA
ncbi:hypothetical protein [Microcoleus sp. S13_B4]|uniref:hypothetical protein n=1 Tax=Microcoleus sp. S13_B4 TaxID=3055408 RepID=UPI002FD41118